jgi:uncharacterized protein YndB with AHSA1/START domain
MTMKGHTMSEFPADRELVISRLLDAPRSAVYRCWTQPELLKQWFAPQPWTTPEASLDVRPGGSSVIVMQSPDGEKMPNHGIYLEVIENEKLVTTDAFEHAWSPKEGQPFMVAILTFEDEAGKTRYTARVRHWTTEARQQHEQMGFHEGWGVCADQLEQLARSI